MGKSNWLSPTWRFSGRMVLSYIGTRHAHLGGGLDWQLCLLAVAWCSTRKTFMISCIRWRSLNQTIVVQACRILRRQDHSWTLQDTVPFGAPQHCQGPQKSGSCLHAELVGA